MNDFNSKLISTIKMAHNDLAEGEYEDEKYSFMLYVFEQLESISKDEIDVCHEDFPYLKIGLDGCHFNEDSNVYNLIYSIYNESNTDESIIDKQYFNDVIETINNLITSISNNKYNEIPDSSLMFEICDDIHKNIKDVEIIVTIVSNFIIPRELQKDKVEVISDINVSFNTYDLLDLKDKFSQLEKEVNTLDLVEKFGEGVKAVKIANTLDFDVYMCAFKGSWLAKLYKEDGQRLLEPNVRSYLKRTQKTNAGIIETVQIYPDQFVSYNNGLSSIASSCDLQIVDNIQEWCVINKIDNFQIVNGGQTTASLAECDTDGLYDELNKVVVPVKLTIIKNIVYSYSLIENISVFSNTQTSIKKSDPPSNLKYYVDLKKISSSIVLTNENGKNYICYFERTSGEYDTELKRNQSAASFKNKNPKEKKFNKIQLGIAINCWQQIPFIVNNGRENNFQVFNNFIKTQIVEVDEIHFKKVYATIILFREIDKLCKKQKLSVKSNVVTYTLSYMSYLSNKRINLLKIFDDQGISQNLIDIINDLLPRIHALIIDAPNTCPEPRMWARKEQLWNKVKKLGLEYNFSDLSQETDFFPLNEAEVFINMDDNFYDASLWKKIQLWNDKQKALTPKQINMIKSVAKAATIMKPLTKNQISYAKDLFMMAVKAGFSYR